MKLLFLFRFGKKSSDITTEAKLLQTATSLHTDQFHLLIPGRLLFFRININHKYVILLLVCLLVSRTTQKRGGRLKYGQGRTF